MIDHRHLSLRSCYAVFCNAASQCCFAATLCSEHHSLLMQDLVAGWACTIRLAISTSTWPSVKH